MRKFVVLLSFLAAFALQQCAAVVVTQGHINAAQNVAAGSRLPQYHPKMQQCLGHDVPMEAEGAYAFYNGQGQGLPLVIRPNDNPQTIAGQVCAAILGQNFITIAELKCYLLLFYQPGVQLDNGAYNTMIDHLCGMSEQFEQLPGLEAMEDFFALAEAVEANALPSSPASDNDWGRRVTIDSVRDMGDGNFIRGITPWARFIRSRRTGSPSTCRIPLDRCTQGLRFCPEATKACLPHILDNIYSRARYQMASALWLEHTLEIRGQM